LHSSPAAGTAASPPPSFPVRFLAAGTCLSHPEKKRGEDAYFASARALGVADGVGGWAEKGIDAGEYARALMVAAERECALHLSRGESPAPLAVLGAAHRSVRLEGSSTAVLVVAGQDGRVRLINVGDSGVQLWRRARLATPMPLSLAEAGRLWSCERTAEMTTHGFNFPKQLAARPDISDKPASGVQAEWGVVGGELLVAASDGVWDNLGEDAIRATLARFDFSPCLAYARVQKTRYEQARAIAAGGGGAPLGIGEGGTGKVLETRYPLAPEAHVSELEVKEREKLCLGQLAGMSAALAMGAQKVGADPRARSPFAEAAARAGMRFSGGKLDDATVVCALVTADPAGIDLYQ
jgi:serine/threonine protein phosphatase PrpC